MQDSTFHDLLNLLTVTQLRALEAKYDLPRGKKKGDSIVNITNHMTFREACIGALRRSNWKSYL